MKNSKLFLALSLGAFTALSGCATTRDVNALNRSAGDSVYARAEAARQPQLTSSTFVVNKGFYASQKPIDIPAPNMRVRLPEHFNKDASLHRYSVGLSDVSSHITRVTGYRVALAPELSGASISAIPEIEYKGNVEGLLDYLAGSLNLSWKWDGQKIELYRHETKMFRLNALAGRTDVSSKLDTTSSSSSGGGSSGGGNTGDSGQTTSIESQFDIWKDVEATVKSMLSTTGSLNIAPSAGIMTVRDTPDVLRQVDAQVREFNRLYSRQVMLNVEVYAVERNAADSVGLDWSMAWSQAAGKYGINFNTVGVGTNNNAPTPTLSGVVNSGPFTGSGLIVQALSSLGKTTLLTSGSVSTLNGQAVPLNIAREQAYLQSYSTSLTSGTTGTATTTLTPGVVTDGFAMNVTPRLLEDNRVMLRFSIDLSTTDGIDTFETPDGNSAIQLPRRSVRNFLQNVSMKSGQTLVLTGLQQTQAGTSESGPLSPKAWMFGGRKQANATTRTIVIIATPYVTQ